MEPDPSRTGKITFTTRNRQALQTLGLPQDNFTGHSFRIGTATSTAQAGIDSKIRKMGRWDSFAFMAYIRTPKKTSGCFLQHNSKLPLVSLVNSQHSERKLKTVD